MRRHEDEEETTAGVASLEQEVDRLTGDVTVATANQMIGETEGKDQVRDSQVHWSVTWERNNTVLIKLKTLK